MVLDTPNGSLTAAPMRPVAFSGDLPVQGRLLAGPVRDVNVIFDPAHWRARVVPLTQTRGPAELAGEPAMLVCLSGEVTLGGQVIPPDAVVLAGPGEPAPRLGAGATGLLVSLQRIA
jgi:hypothetical protein